MLDNTAKYVYEVYRLKSVSLAAKSLYISQPALSAAIKKAEKELGAPIFDRKTLPFSLTPEGKIYIEALEKILNIQKQTADRISDLHESRGGTLRIGSSTHLGYFVIPRILKHFHQRHPQVDINLISSSTAQLPQLLEQETADLILAPASVAPEGCVCVPLLTERFVVVLPDTMPVSDALQPYAVTRDAIVHRTYPPEKALHDLSLLQGTEFIHSPPNTNLHKKRRILFGKPDIRPYITSTAGQQQLNYNLMRAGFGALLTTDANLATMPPNETCHYFVLGGAAATQEFCIIYPASPATSRLTQEFVADAQTLFHGDAPLTKLLRI